MQPAFEPSEATRKTCRHICAMSLFTDRAPQATIFEMCLTAIENDFKTEGRAEHAITKQQNEAVMTWAVSFMEQFCSAMDSFFSERRAVRDD